MESLNKTSSSQSHQVPISPRREDAHFPPPQTAPRAPVLVQELGSGKLSYQEGIQVIGAPGAGGFHPVRSLCPALCIVSFVHCQICEMGIFIPFYR